MQTEVFDWKRVVISLLADGNSAVGEVARLPDIPKHRNSGEFRYERIGDRNWKLSWPGIAGNYSNATLRFLNVASRTTAACGDGCAGRKPLSGGRLANRGGVRLPGPAQSLRINAVGRFSLCDGVFAMPSAFSPIVSPRHVVDVLIRHRLRWIVPLVVVSIAALAYAVFKGSTWEARQALVVRDEAVGGYDRPGRFDSTDAMKTAQETVLELARSRGVVEAALKAVGPEIGPAEAAFPTPADVEDAQKEIAVSAPNGAEFGKTEVFYLKVKDKNRDRAIAMAKAICDQLDHRLGELRDQKAQSLIAELDRTVELARQDLGAATKQLAEMERQAGRDLAELRILNDTTTGESDLRQTLIDVTSELRQAEQAAKTSQQLKAFLQAAQSDPDRLVATPNELLVSQPALRQLKDGLIQVQIQTATLRSTMSDLHPRVQASRAAESQIRRDLHNELTLAISGLDAELDLHHGRMEMLAHRSAELQERMKHLAGIRAEYANRLAEVHRRTEIVTKAEQDLAEARASRAAAHSANLITRLDGPNVGDQPVGPSRSAIVLVGIGGGLMLGLGLVFLTAPVGLVPGDSATAAVVTPATNGTTVGNTALVGGRKAPLRSLSLTGALKRLAAIAPSWN